MTANFRHFFFRGLAILLPSILTIWILITAYNLIQQKIADPISSGVRYAMIHWSPWPKVYSAELKEAEQSLSPPKKLAYLASGQSNIWLKDYTRDRKVAKLWRRFQIPLNLTMLLFAIFLIYVVGMLVGSFIGRRILHRGEEFLHKLPLVKQVYPAIKQITDFMLASEDQSLKFNRVVAVQYPRYGIWSVGLVTGETMRTIQHVAEKTCITIFIPSSPTPFTGYTITVPIDDTIDLPIAVEDALRFTVSGGVVLPPSEIISGKMASMNRASTTHLSTRCDDESASSSKEDGGSASKSSV